MNIYHIPISLLTGGIISGVILYLILKSQQISKTEYQKVKDLLVNSESTNKVLASQFQMTKESLDSANRDIDCLRKQINTLVIENSSLQTTNTNLENNILQHKQDFENIQKKSEMQFQNLANKILEEKTEHFTKSNHNNLKLILDPFQDKINELKNRINEAYEKENKERFSLAEKVKELATLNEQISQDAQKLTRALKGDSKTQGLWGEMILATILEKSGLTLNQEYFLQQQLEDDNKNALQSEFSGKRMRPDALIKYPDNRSVIIDSKVSIRAFAELVDETDPDVYQIKLNSHVKAIRRHIDQLSDKAYDDHTSSLDFVMMFIPSEPAYIAAMQADPSIWNYAYEKRIVLLNPTNLITSLKLMADLWKREYQNRNVQDIADRGAKLYHKFVDFVSALQKAGNGLDSAQRAYSEAFTRLHTGKDNLIVQAQKLKNLGIKNKKELPSELVDRAWTSSENEENAMAQIQEKNVE